MPKSIKTSERKIINVIIMKIINPMNYNKPMKIINPMNYNKPMNEVKMSQSKDDYKTVFLNGI